MKSFYVRIPSVSHSRSYAETEIHIQYSDLLVVSRKRRFGTERSSMSSGNRNRANVTQTVRLGNVRWALTSGEAEKV